MDKELQKLADDQKQIILDILELLKRYNDNITNLLNSLIK